MLFTDAVVGNYSAMLDHFYTMKVNYSAMCYYASGKAMNSICDKHSMHSSHCTSLEPIPEGLGSRLPLSLLTY